jgi:hypothetical protein
VEPSPRIAKSLGLKEKKTKTSPQKRGRAYAITPIQRPLILDAQDSGKAILLTSRTNLEEAKQFENDHDNYNYPDDVEDASVHDGEWYGKLR